MQEGTTDTGTSSARTLKDWRGVPIEVGSRIVYPNRIGSHMWMCEGVVKEVISEFRMSRTYFKLVVEIQARSGWRGHEKSKRPSRLTALDRITVIEYSRVDNGSLSDSESESLGSNPGAGAQHTCGLQGYQRGQEPDPPCPSCEEQGATYRAKARAVGMF